MRKILKALCWSMLLTAVPAALVTSCASSPAQHAIKEVQVCGDGKCNSVAQKYSTDQLRDEFQQLLKANLNEKTTICEADPKTHACTSDQICHFVLGGIIPGPGCSKSLVLNEVTKGGEADQLGVKVKMARTFIGTPLTCATANGTLSIRSSNDIVFELQPHFCNWMVVGNMRATFSFAVESIDMERGELAGYWTHAVVGTGNGSGSGYAVMKFAKSAAHDGLNGAVAQH
jgi:hypothetical protein